MVGRAGRSKACANCRRSKKGCDLVRPGCGQCSAKKLKCEGYNDELTVFSYNPNTPSRYKNLQATAIKIKYSDVFWERFLPSGSKASNWTQLLRDKYDTDDGPFKNAVLAVTLSRVGLQDDNQNIARSGDMHYYACLRQVKKAIEKDSEATKDHIIATCFLLGLYEYMCNPHSTYGWQNHVRGVETLLQLRGPHAFRSGFSHKLFAGVRLEIICLSMVNRKATYLGTSEWLRIPWSEKSTPKSYSNRILDLLAQIPQLLESLDGLHNNDPLNRHSWDTLLEACWKLDDAAQKWSVDFYPICAPVFSNSPHTFDPSVPDLAVPLTAVSRINHSNAQALALYWSVCLYSHAIIRIAWKETGNAPSLLPKRIDASKYAHVISESILFFSSSTAGEGTVIFFMKCVITALHYLGASGLVHSEAYQRMKVLIHPPGPPTQIRTRSGMWARSLLITMSHAAKGYKITGFKELQSRMEYDLGISRMVAMYWWGGGSKALNFADYSTT
ncbi:unnamed protein product [Periconia digitata]|uniref:Zn(2)-C6 fungal-type domain-containing protein n=1 Tax=Periconia digitata TaxID=1303443 RepID=A0A9W4XW55_9PLEO|nr:unnamed protein product [Periconia digitata]